MQTFLPFACFEKSASVLDKKRCWQQVREAKAMVTILESDKKSPYRNHAATRQWKGYNNALKHYMNVFLNYCKLFHKIKTQMEPYSIMGEIILPPWLGYEPLHSSHRGRLLEKKYEFYSQYGWSEKPCGYIWAVDKEYHLIPEIEAWIKQKG